ncbi:hypothetical protein KGQ20_41710 [Catenulispora sp. NF23]|uniref:hypothetical protein n=1 Tax=Catenulispora pinistramenti TaxID=2705254 RepID=UPI001BA5FEC6|nr:hypothetical protein [Catenulispora pinistramenti]MBS2539282.1 hypothetical protein [Catenulispora pinistramenti]
MPFGISAVVQAPPLCAEPAAEVGAAAFDWPPVPPVEVPAAELEADVEADPVPPLPPGPDEPVAAGVLVLLPVELVLPSVDVPLPALLEALLEHPVNATALSAPAANKTEIRFISLNLPG